MILGHMEEMIPAEQSEAAQIYFAYSSKECKDNEQTINSKCHHRSQIHCQAHPLHTYTTAIVRFKS